MANWPLPPIVPGPWRNVSELDAVALAARLGNALGSRGAGLVWYTEVRRFRALSLEFFPGWLLVEFESRLDEQEVGFAGFLYGPDMQIVPLDLTSDPIHYVASVTPPDLSSPRKLLGFLRCFCGAIASEDGRFRIVASRSEVPLVDAPLADAAERVLSQIRRPRITWRNPDEGGQRSASVVAHMLYAEHLFRATYEVAGSQVTMTAEIDLGPLPLRYELIRPPFRLLLPGLRPVNPPADSNVATGEAR